jgi:hypothetical protein
MSPKITIIATPTGLHEDVIAHYFRNINKMEFIKPEDAPLCRSVLKMLERKL